MTANLLNPAAFLRTSREFPEDLKELVTQLNKSYIEIANAVNERIISLFPTTRPVLTGESWYVKSNQRQQTLRQAFPFVSGTNPIVIKHNIIVPEQTYFTKTYGEVTDGTNWYPLPYVDVTSATNQISLQVTPSNIVITLGSGSPPSITFGIVILEWMSQV